MIQLNLGRMGTEKRAEISPKTQIPGPGNYAYKTTIGEGPKIGLSPRLEGKKATTLAPGPGAYNPKSDATIEKMPAPGMGYGSRSGLNAKSDLKVPGPGTYNSLISMKTGPKYGFGTGQRSSIQQGKDKVPGPGNYDVSASVESLPAYERSKMK